MTKTHDYEIALAGLADWDEFLLRESGLPGPRGNLELADAFARVAGEDLMVRYAALGPDVAPTNSPQEFLAFCGVLGFGRLVAEGQRSRLADLRRAAGDPRWRLREACARALQIFGRRRSARPAARSRGVVRRQPARAAGGPGGASASPGS